MFNSFSENAKAIPFFSCLPSFCANSQSKLLKIHNSISLPDPFRSVWTSLKLLETSSVAFRYIVRKYRLHNSSTTHNKPIPVYQFCRLELCLVFKSLFGTDWRERESDHFFLFFFYLCVCSEHCVWIAIVENNSLPSIQEQMKFLSTACCHRCQSHVRNRSM